MLHALFHSANLLGDGLMTTPALRAFYREKEKEGVEITVATLPDFTAQIYSRMDVPIKVVSTPYEAIPEEDYDFVHKLDIGCAWQIGIPNGLAASLAFAMMLGVAIESTLPYYIIPPEILEELDHRFDKSINRILLQPYSKSCSSWTNEPANKRWQDEKWLALYREFKEMDSTLEILVVGGSKDYFLPGIPEENHWLGKSLDEVAWMQKHAVLVVTIDSGAAHLAATQMARTVEMYPNCIPSGWMGKFENPNYHQIYCRPWDVEVDFVFNQCIKVLG